MNWNLGWDKSFDMGTSLAPETADIRNSIFQISSPVNCVSFLDVYSESICWVWFGIKKDKFVEVAFGEPLHRIIANIISVLSFLVLVFWSLARRYKHV